MCTRIKHLNNKCLSDTKFISKPYTNVLMNNWGIDCAKLTSEQKLYLETNFGYDLKQGDSCIELSKFPPLYTRGWTFHERIVKGVNGDIYAVSKDGLDCYVAKVITLNEETTKASVIKEVKIARDAYNLTSYDPITIRIYDYYFAFLPTMKGKQECGIIIMD